MSAVSLDQGTRPRTCRSLTDELEEIVATLATSQYELVTRAAEFADAPEWILTGSPTPAHWLAAIADVEPCTAREWVRIGRCLQQLPATSEALRTRGSNPAVITIAGGNPEWSSANKGEALASIMSVPSRK